MKTAKVILEQHGSTSEYRLPKWGELYWCEDEHKVEQAHWNFKADKHWIIKTPIKEKVR